MSDAMELLRRADPAAGVPVGPGDADEVLRRAAHDVTTYEAEPPRPARRRGVLLAAAGVTALLVAGGVGASTLSGSGGAPVVPQAPSPSPGGHCLTDLAGRLQPAPYDGGSGRYEYLRLDMGSGLAVDEGKGSLARANWRADVRQWLADDGSGQLDTTRGPVSYADRASEEYFAARPEMLVREPRTTFGPGEYSRRPVPADPAAMAEQLSEPRENGPSQALVNVADLSRQWLLGAAQRAAVLRFLAGVDGVACAGEETTPEGRTGIRVTAPRGEGPHPSPGDQGGEALLFDTGTGELLAGGGSGTGVPWEMRVLERGYRDTIG
ncbi:hypothetical protein ACFFX1_50970 [Dactylosporangium sucinum]|uniref:CU044_5270 family protein n=1 Tax=Dactylosporangium sucinum TaxID=1424081 RepID=A0A917U390_9ACTN|nr:hypothetical protein [Dactylosporangium sucinum]GGM54457.1 hypothetical protein GCM10007977_065110 [Dactylosporangium sucinum]